MDYWIADVKGNGDPRDSTAADVVLPSAERMAGGFDNLSSGVWETDGYYCRFFQVLHRYSEIQICRCRLELVGATAFGRLPHVDLPGCFASSYSLEYAVAIQNGRLDYFDPPDSL